MNALKFSALFMIAVPAAALAQERKDPRMPRGCKRRWRLAGEFAKLAKGTRLQPFEDRFTAAPEARIPAPVEIVNVGAIIPARIPRARSRRS